MRPSTCKLEKKTGVVALLLLCCSCSLKQTAVSIVGSAAWDGQSVLEGESDVAYARETTPSLLVALDVLRQSHQHDKKYAALLAKAYGQYAFGFYEEDLLTLAEKDPHALQSAARADRFYQRGRDIGLTALQKKRAFQKGETSLPHFETAVKSVGRGEVPLLFWTAFCWAGWINLHRDDPFAYVDLPKVTAMIDRVLELEPDYYFGAAQSFRAVLDASRPPMLGGNPAHAKELFEAAVAVEPRYLMTKVLYAQYSAVQMQDRALFEHLLSEVIAADEKLFPEQGLANAIAKRRAKLLLDRKNDWF